jgi:hypothetical protein
MNIINILKNTCNKVFGNNFHIDYDEGPFTCIITIMLLYPELTITNENGNSVKVRNHIQSVKLHYYIDDDKIHFYDNCVKGITLKPTFQQFIKGYQHSHLNSGYRYSDDDFELNHSTFKRYCLGSSSQPCVKIMHEFGQKKPVSEFMPHFEYFLHNLIVLAETESIAGKPYIKLENIVLNKNLAPSLTNSRFYEVISEYKKSINKNVVDFKINKGILNVVDNENLEDHILDALPNDIKTDNYYNTCFCRKDGLGNYFSNISLDNYNGYLNEVELFKEYYVQFGDRRIQCDVIHNEVQENYLKIYIHPKIKENVKKIIEKQANREAIRVFENTKG